MYEQVLFKDSANDDLIFGGIRTPDGDIICGCCGGLLEKDDPDIEIIEVYKNWVSISDEIIGE